MTEGAGAQRAESHRFRLVLLVVLLVLVAGSIVFTVVVATTRQVDAFGIDDVKQSQAEDRGTVQSQARQFVLRVLNYGPEMLDDNGRMPAYRDSVSELLTAKFQESFDTEVTAAEQTVAAGSSRKGEVYATGVSSIDPDSARVVVASSYVQTYPTKAGTKVSSDPFVFRVDVDLIRTRGKWLVDSFAPVVDPAGSVGDPTSVPTLPPGTTAPTTAPTGTPSSDEAPPATPATSPGAGATP